MTPLVPIVLFGWPLVCSVFFSRYPLNKAILLSIIGGVLFLPAASYDIPVIPAYNKDMAVSLGILIGIQFSKEKFSVRIPGFTKWDFPMLVLCVFSPILTSLSNRLGLYDGISGVLSNIFRWGVVYWTGRRYLTSDDSLDALSKAIIIGGLIYVPLALFELRMSPSLHRMIYGFAPFSFAQQIRYGGYRPVIFLEHGIIVAFWMMSAFVCALWRSGDSDNDKIAKMPSWFVVLVLLAITILCKSVGVWTYLFLILLMFFIWKHFQTLVFFKLYILIIVTYIIVRTLNLITINDILELLSHVYDGDRISSLTWRLLQEDLFGERTKLRPLFGWGGYNRGWPINQQTGDLALPMVDSLFVIISNTYGYVGLTAFFLSLLLGPFLILKNRTLIKRTYESGFLKSTLIPLISIALLFTSDKLLNATHNQILYLLVGSLLGFAIKNRPQKGLTENKSALSEKAVDSRESNPV